MPELAIHSLSADAFEAELDAMAELLHACVHAGANVNFVLPFEIVEARAFWAEKALPSMRAGLRPTWAARLGSRLAGLVQLDLDTPPNQPQRAEVTKLLVHPDARRRGLARALMAALEADAVRRGLTLLTLDTRTGDAAEPLYASLGYETVGQIPDFCRDPIEDRLHATTIMYKRL